MLINIIPWNIRVLGRPAKRFLVKDFFNLHLTDVCCLQESKLEEIAPALWREIGGSKLDNFFFVPASGSAGGIIMGLNSGFLTGKLHKVESFSLTIEFFSKCENLTWQ